MEQKKEDLIPLKEAAEIVKLLPDTLRRYAQKGKIEGEKPSGRWYFRREVLEAIKKTSPPTKKPVLPPKDTEIVQKQLEDLTIIAKTFSQTNNLRLKQINIRPDTNHPDNLAECAKLLVKILRFYHEYWAEDSTIEDILTDLDDFDAIEFFNNKLTQGLLVHLSQSKEFPELKVLHCWFDLEVGKITETFLNLISLKAALKQFEGECDLCRAKPGPKKKCGLKLK